MGKAQDLLSENTSLFPNGVTPIPPGGEVPKLLKKMISRFVISIRKVRNLSNVKSQVFLFFDEKFNIHDLRHPLELTYYGTEVNPSILWR